MALTAYSLTGRRHAFGNPATATATAPDLLPNGDVSADGRYLGQFDSYRVVACCAVVLQHSLLWNVAVGNTTAWAFVMLLHFSRTAFFFLTAFLLTYAEIHRPRPVTAFWRQRYIEIGVPYLVWTGIYWVFTMIVAGSWDQAGSLLWNYLVFGYYQLYFVVVLLQLYLVFPLLLRLLRASKHHVAVMVASGLFALALAADLHYTQYFGVVGDATRSIASVWPWARGPDHLPGAVRGGRPGRVALRRGPAVRRAPLAPGDRAGCCWWASWPPCGTWSRCGPARTPGGPRTCTSRWRSCGSPPPSPRSSAAPGPGTGARCAAARAPRRWPRLFSAEYLAGLTGGIFFCHVLFLNLIRTALGDSGIAPHLGWAGLVALTFVLTMACAARVHRTHFAHAAASGAHGPGARGAAGTPRHRRALS